MPVPRFVTIPQAAEALQVDERTVRRWIASGDLPARRIAGRAVRILEEDLAAVGRPLNVRR